MYGLDLIGIRQFINSKKQHLDMQDELNLELQDEREILYKYVEELRSNEETKYIVPSDLALAVYEPEKNELTKMLNQNFKEILKEIKEKAHLYSYFVYIKRYILTKLSINSLSYEFDSQMNEEKRIGNYFNTLNSFEVGKKINDIPLDNKSKYELIKEMLETINLDDFEVKTINDSLPVSKKEDNVLEALMVKFQSIIKRHLITKEDLWNMIKTYKLNKDLKTEDTNIICIKSIIDDNPLDEDKTKKEKDNLKLLESIYLYLKRKEELSSMTTSELLNLVEENRDMPKDSLIEAILRKEGLNNEGIDKINELISFESYSHRFDNYTVNELIMLTSEYKKERERINEEKNKLKKVKYALKNKIDTLVSKNKPKESSLKKENNPKELYNRLKCLIKFALHNPVKLLYSKKDFDRLEEDLNSISIKINNSMINNIVDDIKYMLDFMKKYTFNFKDRSIFTKISSYDFKKFKEIRTNLSKFTSSNFEGRKIFLFNIPANTKNNLEILEMDVSKEDALLLGLTTEIEEINSKEEELSKEYNDNNSKINFLEDYLIPSRRGNKDIWLDFSNLIRQNILRNNEQEKNKVLIKNQRELTSLFLLYVIM